MSKKYRLIKEYPGSPKLGTMGEVINKTVMYTETDNDIPYYSTGYIDFKKHPEYWEEIVEKDYEILSFYAKNISGKGDYFVDKEYIWYETSKGNGKWSRKGYITAPYNTQEITNHNSYGIHSVIRLSDDEVFTIGDDIIVGSNNKRKLHSFILNRDKILVCDNISINNAKWSLSNIRKIKPLFTTEDGVDIFENCEVYQINDNFTISCYTSWKNYYGDNGIPKSGYKWFSTREKAEEYVLMNKPCLSINDLKNHNIFNARSLNKNTDKYLFIEELKELIKSKL